MAFIFAGQYGPEPLFTSSSKLLPNTLVTVYVTGTTTPATLYADRLMSTTVANPTVTDDLGNLTIYTTPGQYDIVADGVTLTIAVPVDPDDVGGGGGSGIPTSGGTFTGTVNWVYSGATPTTVMRTSKISTDSTPRWVALANGQEQIGTPFAPTSWGTHNAGNVGAGSDFQWGMEILGDYAHGMMLSFPRIWLTASTGNMFVSFYPWTGTSLNTTLQVSARNGVVPPNTAGSVTWSSVFYGNGVVNYTGTTGAGTASGTLTGCTIASGTISTTFTDQGQRTMFWVTDTFGAPIWWLADFFGMYLNDTYNVAAGGVFTDLFNDITLGFSTNGTGGQVRSPLTGALPLTAVTALQFGRNSAAGGTGTNGWSSGGATMALTISRFNDALANGYLKFAVGGGFNGNNTWFMGPGVLYPSTPANLGSTANPLGRTYAASGTAALPAYTFGADATTGFWRNTPLGVSAIGVSVGGVEVLQMNPTGMFPVSDNAYSMGNASNRWSSVTSVLFGGGNASAATPTYAWNNDLTTGFYRVAAGTIGFASAGVLSAVMSAAGVLPSSAAASATAVNTEPSLRPAGWTSESIPRRGSQFSNTVGASATGTLRMNAVYLQQGTVVSHIIWVTGTTPGATMTHNWMGLYDQNLVQLATTADQTSAAIAASSTITQAIAAIASGAASSFTTTYSGIHYLGWMVAATTLPTLYGQGGTSNLVTGLAPILSGTSDTAQSTPPAFPHTATALTSTALTYCGTN